MIKTFTIDDDKWRVVPLMPDEKMIEAGDSIRHGRIKTSIIYMHMLAAAPQPEQVESEPVALTNKTQLGYVTDGMHPDIPLAMWSKNTTYADANIPLYTQLPADASRVAELEAETTKLKLDLLTSYGESEELSGKVAELEKALKVARDALDEAVAGMGGSYAIWKPKADEALAKINEVLKP